MELAKDAMKDLFSSKLGNFEADVPASLWGGIDLLLSQLPIPVIDPSASSVSSSSSAGTTTAAASSKTIALVVGIAASVAIVGGGAFMYMSQDSPVGSQHEITAVLPPSIVESNDTLDTPQIVAITPLKSIERDLPASEAPSSEEELHRAKDADQIEEKVPNKVEKRNGDKFLATLSPEELAPASTSSPLRGLSLSLNTGASLLSGDISQLGIPMFLGHQLCPTLVEDIVATNNIYTLDHQQPITFGLMLSKKIGTRLSLETGLIYTHLLSTLKSSGIYRIEEEQQFDYLGLPLFVHYTFWQAGKTNFYVSLGGVIQKDIRGRYTGSLTNFNAGNKGSEIFYPKSTLSTKKISQDNLQLSTRLSLGVAQPIYKNIFLYGTIGGAYYFDAANAYQTIYSDRKMQLDINVGLKFEF